MLRQCQRTTPGNAARQPQALRGVIRQGLARSRADPCHNRPNAPSLRLIPEGEYPDTLTGRRVFRLGLRDRGRMSNKLTWKSKELFPVYFLIALCAITLYTKDWSTQSQRITGYVSAVSFFLIIAIQLVRIEFQEKVSQSTFSNGPSTELERLEAERARLVEQVAELHRQLQEATAAPQQAPQEAGPAPQQATAAPQDDDKDPLHPKRETTYLNIIGALVELIQSPRDGRDGEAAVIREIVDNYGDRPGISKRNLEGVFPLAKKRLQSD